MGKIEPFSVVAAILLLFGFLFGGILGILALIVGAILLSVSQGRFKKNPEYTAKWVLYIGAIILVLSILLRLFGMSLVLLF